MSPFYKQFLQSCVRDLCKSCLANRNFKGRYSQNEILGTFVKINEFREMRKTLYQP
jgi:hypothetical protein